ncbi:MAG: hypothetical protein AABW73_00735 [Nanoarchaeota archaeon]
MIALYDPLKKELGFYIDEKRESARSYLEGPLIVKGMENDGVLRRAAISFPRDAMYSEFQTNSEFFSDKPRELTQVSLTLTPWARTRLDEKKAIIPVKNPGIEVIVSLEPDMSLLSSSAA